MTMTVEEVRGLAASELSVGTKLGHVALLLAALTMAGVTGALAATEPALPARTLVALAVMSAIGWSWAGYAAWVLVRRDVGLARHNVIASRMAVAYSALFALAAGAGAVWTGGSQQRVAFAAVGTGVVMLMCALVLLVRAQQRRRALLARRATLEAQLAPSKARG